jgi:hypothetical protein
VEGVTSSGGFEDVMANFLSLLTLHLSNSEGKAAQLMASKGLTWLTS